MSLLFKYFDLKFYQLATIIIAGNLLLIWLSKSLLINETVFYNAYSEQLTYERAIKLFEDFQRISWINYVINPLVLFLKYSLVSLLLYIGIIFNNMQYKVTLGSVLKVVIASDIVFLFSGLIKFFWFYFIAQNYSLTDMGFFYPLSLINLFKVDEIDKFWIYPLQTINLFHLTYLLLLSYGLTHYCKISRNDSDKIVLSSYLPGLIMWITIVLFISIDILT
jgi:hypothetical protein